MAQDDISFSVAGLKELNNTLDQLGPALKKKGARFALRKAANLVRDSAMQNAQRIDDPKTKESIVKNIAVRFSGRTFKRTGDLKFRVGVLGGARGYAKASGEFQGAGKENPGGDTFHWRFVEFGTSEFPAVPFIRPAMEQNIGRATDEFSVQLDRWLARNLKKLQKQGLI